MEWEIIIHQAHNYIEVVTKGVADKDDSLEMAKIITKTMRSNRFAKAMIDHRSIEKATGNIIEIYERPKLFRVLGVALGIKIAEIINPDHFEHFHFLETVCRNRGYNFSIFYEKISALEWLLEKECRAPRGVLSQRRDLKAE